MLSTPRKRQSNRAVRTPQSFASMLLAPISVYLILIVLTPIMHVGIGVPFRFDDVFLLYLAFNLFRKGQVRLTLVSKAFAWLCVSALVSLLLGYLEGKRYSFSEANTAFVYFRLVLIALVVQRHIRSVRDVRQCMVAFYAASCVSMLVAMIQYLRIDPLVEITFNLFSGSDLYRQRYLVEASSGHVFRVIATMANPNHAACLFVISTVICLGYIARIFKWRLALTLVLLASIAAFVFVVIVAVSSRTGLVLLGICAVTYLLVHMVPTKKKTRDFGRVFTGVFFFAVIGIGFYNMIPEEMLPRRMQAFLASEDGSRSFSDDLQRSRVDNWQVALYHVKSHNSWLFGIGPRLDLVIDNGYLEILYAQGISGLFPLIFLCVWPLATLRKTMSLDDLKLVSTVFTVIVAFLGFGFTGPIITSAKLGAVFAVFLAIWQCLVNGARRKKATPKGRLKIPVRLRET